MRISKHILTAIVLIIIISAVAGCSDVAPENQAPDFTLRGLDGEEYSLSDYEGSSVVLNFFATWCGPCQMETPFFEAAHADTRWQDEGVVFLAIDRAESVDSVRAFRDFFNVSFPILLDDDLSVFTDYNVLSGIPVTVFIDKHGIIGDIKTGAFPSLTALESSLEKLVGK